MISGRRQLDISGSMRDTLAGLGPGQARSPALRSNAPLRRSCQPPPSRPPASTQPICCQLRRLSSGSSSLLPSTVATGGSTAQPLIFWILFGAGLSGSFRMAAASGASVSFQEYFLPGAALMIVLFTSIFSSISVIQDRNEGFLQGVLASPVPRLSLVLGKLCGGALLALTQAMLFLLAAPLLQYVGLASEMPLGFSIGQGLAMTGVLFLTGLGMAGLGFLFAWKIDSVQGFHGIMSVLLMPMWLLSGAFFSAGRQPLAQLGRRPEPAVIWTVSPAACDWAGRHRLSAIASRKSVCEL